MRCKMHSTQCVVAESRICKNGTFNEMYIWYNMQVGGLRAQFVIWQVQCNVPCKQKT